MNGNLEYRYTIAGPVAIAPFVDTGTVAILRTSQLQINPIQYQNFSALYFGCPILTPAFTCYTKYTTRGNTLGISQYLKPVPGTNWVPRMSTGLELQVMLPVINAPFRIYYAYNAMRLNSTASAPIAITRQMFPAPVSCVCPNNQAAGKAIAIALPRHLVIRANAGNRSREHLARDCDGRTGRAVKTHRIVGIVDAEGRVDDRQHYLQFEAGGHARNPIRARHRL